MKADISKARIEASKFIDFYTFETPEDIRIEDIAMDQGLIIRESVINGAEARLVQDGKNGVITVNIGGDPRRKRFAIAHEIGHWKLHRDNRLADLCTTQDLTTLTDASSIETEANIFASELLMPRNLFLQRCRNTEPNIQTIKKLSEIFDTSLTSTALRFIDFTDENCFLVYSKDSEIIWWRKNQKSGLKINEYDQIQKNSSAWKCASGQLTESEMKRISTDAWFPSPPKALHVEVQEQSIKLGAYPYVLTLLWVSEEEKSYLDEDDDDL